jgi:N-acetylmuramoyl-L-alanine amidase
MQKKMIIYPSFNFDERSSSAIIDTIIIHHTVVNRRESLKMLTDFHTKVSCHYLIGATGQVYRLVSCKYRAWHAGESYWRGKESLNDSSIGIELVNNGKSYFTKPQMSSLIALCKMLQERYPAIQQRNIIGHMDIAPHRKDDPSHKFRWSVLAQAGVGVFHDVKSSWLDKVIVKQGDSGDAVSKVQRSLKSYGYGIKLNDVYDKNMCEVVKAFKQHFCDNIDGTKWRSYEECVIKKLLKL